MVGELFEAGAELGLPAPGQAATITLPPLPPNPPELQPQAGLDSGTML